MQYPIRLYLHLSEIASYKEICSWRWQPLWPAAYIWRQAKRYWGEFPAELKSLVLLFLDICTRIIHKWPNMHNNCYFISLPTTVRKQFLIFLLFHRRRTSWSCALHVSWHCPSNEKSPILLHWVPRHLELRGTGVAFSYGHHWQHIRTEARAPAS